MTTGFVTNVALISVYDVLKLAQPLTFASTVRLLTKLKKNRSLAANLPINLLQKYHGTRAAAATAYYLQ